MSARSSALPSSRSTIRSIAPCTSADGLSSTISAWRWRIRAHVFSRLPIGSCTPLMPRGPHSIPQPPIAVSNRAKYWLLMVGSKTLCPIMRSRQNLCLEIVAIHPDSGNPAQPSRCNSVFIHPALRIAGTKQAEPFMQTLHVNGYDMAYLDVGKGPPLVCVHGSLCDFRIWGAVIGPLSARHRVIAVSLRHFFPEHWDGVGDTYSITQHVQDVIAFIEKLGVGPADLMGHSRGEHISFRVAQRRPDLVRKLILPSR